MSYSKFFRTCTDNAAYPYQERLGTEHWPDLLDVPTGLGKTAAVVVAWLWKRMANDPHTPRRLVYCLPMRSLVEQTYDVTAEWLVRAEREFQAAGRETPRLYKLLGGDVDNEWMQHPEKDSILVGTQDMLLSRALMRGYGVSLYTWPMHFGFLHFDALWMFDEVQLMGPGLATSAQLEGFRRVFGTGKGGSRSLWCSATISKEWLGTVDFRCHLDDLRSINIGPEDCELASRRLNASKRVERARTVFDSESSAGVRAYAESIATEVRDAHMPGTRTIVICNTVDRAQSVYRALHAFDSRVLIHSRFRPPERQSAIVRLLREPPPEGTIVVATQVIEAGIDLTSANLFTELCPWSSFVQRIGRCNRGGEHDDATIFWIDMKLEDARSALPYDAEELARTRCRVEKLQSAAPALLPHYEDPSPLVPVIRRRDLIDLFSTDADLCGFHTDVSDYIRDSDERNLFVFWREEGSGWSRKAAPQADELCAASIVAMREMLKSRSAWLFDPIADGSREKGGTWRRAMFGDIRPGMTLMLDAKEGGYSGETGFDPGSKGPVIVTPREGIPPESIGEDRLSRTGYWMKLQDHLEHTRRHAARIAEDLGLDRRLAVAVEEAALWHDVGKLHEVFQESLLSSLESDDQKQSSVWAKGPWARATANEAEEKRRWYRRRFFRHELPGALAYLDQGRREDRELIAYLVAAHHGKVRTSLRALPTEPEPNGESRRYARGVWEGDELGALSIGDRLRLSPMTLSLEVMELGGGSRGRSWGSIVEDLLSEHGPFELALLEAVVRIADWRASGEAECWCEKEGDVVRLRDE